MERDEAEKLAYKGWKNPLRFWWLVDQLNFYLILPVGIIAIVLGWQLAWWATFGIGVLTAFFSLCLMGLTKWMKKKNL